MVKEESSSGAMGTLRARVCESAEHAFQQRHWFFVLFKGLQRSSASAKKKDVLEITL